MRANTVHIFTSTRVHVTCARTHDAQQTTRLIPLLPPLYFSFFFQSILPSTLQPCSFFKEPTLLLHHLLRSLARSRALGHARFCLSFSHTFLSLSFSFTGKAPTAQRAMPNGNASRMRPKVGKAEVRVVASSGLARLKEERRQRLRQRRKKSHITIKNKRS